MSVIKFVKVAKRFSGNNFPVLQDVSFSIPERSFQFLTGPSGSGKSTLLRLIYRRLLPTSGNVEIFGIDTRKITKEELASARQRIGLVLQDFFLMEHLSIYENVAAPLRLAGRDESSYRRELIDLLEWVGLGQQIDSLPRTVSGGQRQRALIARAVLTRPQILLADEPTANVESALARRILSLFIQLNTAGTAVLLATHDIALMDQYEARRLVLHQGVVHVYD